MFKKPKFVGEMEDELFEEEDEDEDEEEEGVEEEGRATFATLAAIECAAPIIFIEKSTTVWGK